MRNAILVLAIILAAGTVLAEQPPPPDQILRGSLSLSDDQLIRIQQLLARRQSAVGDVMQRRADLQRRLEATLNGPAADPAAVGALVISIRGVEREMSGQQENVHRQFLSILTAEQRQRVEMMGSLRAMLAGAEALERLGL